MGDWWSEPTPVWWRETEAISILRPAAPAQRYTSFVYGIHLSAHYGSHHLHCFLMSSTGGIPHKVKANHSKDMRWVWRHAGYYLRGNKKLCFCSWDTVNDWLKRPHEGVCIHVRVCVYSVAAHVTDHMFCCWSCVYSKHFQDWERNLCLLPHPKPKLSHTPYHLLATFNPLLDEEQEPLPCFSTTTSIPAGMQRCMWHARLLFQPQGAGEEKNQQSTNGWPQGFTRSLVSLIFLLCLPWGVF